MMSNQLITQCLDSGVQYPQAVNIVTLVGQMNVQFDNINQQLNSVSQQLNRLVVQTLNGCILMFNHLLPIGMDY
jgi:hypothetical protein